MVFKYLTPEEFIKLNPINQKKYTDKKYAHERKLRQNKKYVVVANKIASMLTGNASISYMDDSGQISFGKNKMQVYLFRWLVKVSGEKMPVNI